MTDTNKKQAAFDDLDSEQNIKHRPSEGAQFVLSTRHKTLASSAAKQHKNSGKGRKALRRRHRDQCRRNEYNITLGLMADVLVKIDPGLQDGATSGGCSLQSRPQLLRAAVEKLRSLHEENERKKRIIEALEARQQQRQESTTATGSAPASPLHPPAPSIESVGEDSQRGSEERREEILPQQDEQGRQLAERPHNPHGDSFLEDLMHSKFSLPQRPVQPCAVPSAVPSEVVSNASLQGGLSGTFRNHNNHLLVTQRPANLTTAVAQTDHLRRRMLVPRLQLIQRTNSANLPLNVGGARSIQSPLFLGTTPSAVLSVGMLQASACCMFLPPPPSLLNGSAALYSTEAAAALGGRGYRQSSNNPLIIRDMHFNG